jgi:hypothetical protein
MLSKSTVHMGLSLLNWFGYITPNEWDTFIQQYTTPQVVALSNKIKELNMMNKFRHKLGPRRYKAAMSKWAKKKQELRDTGIPNPLEGGTVRTKN